ncbi:hypothetical protein P152DRAFT_89074 [Eremomyces bilateralis CBS 781.70]|uniref:Uncharacterized protein n=1 Tax=Eremomyces bilateralis CBS 781.70 TaxID=1392243 RepID=A0A6G1FXX2_9PEZI|nr:uncharacterized protein P152DRAFT_89074 [Eremomyces bilateralis CBS 781.70]KAF1810562.1 hypothetical protein P152DRAFT_89074 [Eremomyces bilateralis CBS 781.70]
MALVERNPNTLGGRNSYASDFSTQAKAGSPVDGSKGDTPSLAPAVLNMLTTSTGIGDLDGRLPGTSRNSHHGHHAWLSTSSAPLFQPEWSHSAPGSRSMSPTTNMQRSSTALSNPSLTSLSDHDPIPRQTSPYHYSTRLKRSGYRPASMTLSPHEQYQEYSVDRNQHNGLNDQQGNSYQISSMDYENPSGYERTPRLVRDAGSNSWTPKSSASPHTPGGVMPRRSLGPLRRTRVISTPILPFHSSGQINEYGMPSKNTANINPPEYYDYSEQFEGCQEKVSSCVKDELVPSPTRLGDGMRTCQITRDKILEAIGASPQLTSTTEWCGRALTTETEAKTDRSITNQPTSWSKESNSQEQARPEGLALTRSASSIYSDDAPTASSRFRSSDFDAVFAPVRQHDIRGYVASCPVPHSPPGPTMANVEASRHPDPAANEKEVTHVTPGSRSSSRAAFARNWHQEENIDGGTMSSRSTMRSARPSEPQSNHYDSVEDIRRDNQSPGMHSHRRHSPELAKEVRFSHNRTHTAGSGLPRIKERPSMELGLVGGSSKSTNRISIATMPEVVTQLHETRQRPRLGVRPPQGQSAFRHSTSGIDDMKPILSMEFSNSNIMTQLKEEFQLRTPRSLDELGLNFDDMGKTTTGPDNKPKTQHESVCSSESIHEKYKSFFAGLEEMDTSLGDNSSIFDSARLDQGTEVLRLEGVGRAREPKISTEMRPRPLSLRPIMGPEELISEVSQVSIPSVSDLTRRLSEVLPSLQKYLTDVENTSEDEVNKTIQEIKAIGDSGPSHEPTNPASLANGRKSLGTDVIEMKEHGNMSDSRENNFEDDLSRTAFARKTPVAELEATPLTGHAANSYVRTMAAHRSDRFEDPDSHLNRPQTSSSAPWNNDSNYPWTESAPDINVCLPRTPPELTTHFGTRAQLHGVNMIEGSTVENEGPLAGTEEVAMRNTEHGIFHAISRRLGHHHPQDINAHHAITPTAGPSTPRPKVSNAPIPLDHFDYSGYGNRSDALCIDDPGVDPGDRYPTTSLSPPTATNLDDVRSYFSDDSERPAKHRSSFRKRLSNFHPHICSGNARRGPALSGLGASAINTGPQSEDIPMEPNGSAMKIGNGGPDKTTMTAPTEMVHMNNGISKADSQPRKLEKGLKAMWRRSGKLIRSMGGKLRKERMEDHA